MSRSQPQKNNLFGPFVVLLLVAFGTLASAADAAQDVQRLEPLWQRQSAFARPGDSVFIGRSAMVQPKLSEDVWRLRDGKYVAAPRHLRRQAGTPASQQHAVATFTVPEGEAGFYEIKDSLLRVDDGEHGPMPLRVVVRHRDRPAAQQPDPHVMTLLGGGEEFRFDVFLGYLVPGDRVHVALGPPSDGSRQEAEIAFRPSRARAIGVGKLSEALSDGQTAARSQRWALMAGVPAGDGAARMRAWGHRDHRPGTAFGRSEQVSGLRVELPLGNDGAEQVVSFRAPQSGYYGLHEATARLVEAGTGPAEARIYIDGANQPHRVVAIGPDAVNLETEIGYVQHGRTVSVALAGEGPATVELDFTVVEWAPRRPPLRVSRGRDGLLEVYTPDQPTRAVDIPAERWINVPADATDATERIRRAFQKAAELSRDGGFAGVRLEADAHYRIAAGLDGNDIFPLEQVDRIIFDGNGATLDVRADHLEDRRMRLFHIRHSSSIVLADFAVTSERPNHTVGEILHVSPMRDGQQTVTFRLLAGQPTPEFLSESRRFNGYAYHPNTPGRLYEGNWSHYPKPSDIDGPNVVPTDIPVVYRHTVARTDNSIPAGGQQQPAKWVLKKKGGGYNILECASTVEDVTLWRVVGGGAIRGVVRFWGADGVNVLDCRFEPDDGRWISLSCDGFHGRGREAIWMANVLIRAVCEDVSNMYARTLVVVADEDPEDRQMTMALLQRNNKVKPPSRAVADDGDRLVFIDTRTGRLLGRTTVIRRTDDGKFTLTRRVPGVSIWRPGDGKRAVVAYAESVVSSFFIRDCRFMDSMRFGVYCKARRGAIFNTHFQGLAGHAIMGANEPTWPEGPVPSQLWVQDCTFAGNNYSYMGRNRQYLSVDPAEISIYTRRLSRPTDPDTHEAYTVEDEYASDHLRLVGNSFHQWRGMGIAVRNARSLEIADNLFYPPVADPLVRRVLQPDRYVAGAFTGVFVDSVKGLQLRGNRLYGLDAEDRLLSPGEHVGGLIQRDNQRSSFDLGDALHVPITEWFGDSARVVGGSSDTDAVFKRGGATWQAGRFDSAASFDASGRPAELIDPSGNLASLQAQSLGLWIRLHAEPSGDQIIWTQGDNRTGLALVRRDNRLLGGVWQNGDEHWIDLGPVVLGVWQPVVLVYDGQAGRLVGYVEGMERATGQGLPAQLDLAASRVYFGGSAQPTRCGPGNSISGGQGNFAGSLDEIYVFSRSITDHEVRQLALRKTAN